MQYISIVFFLLVSFVWQIASLLPPKFQWRNIDFAWKEGEKDVAINNGQYIVNNNMPTGVARWKEKLFITIPRWKKGVPSSLNYVFLNGSSDDEPLHPYPNWKEGCLGSRGFVTSNRTVVSTFRVHVDKYDQLWVVDNGVDDMSVNVKQLAPPSLSVFDLNTDNLLKKHIFDDSVLRDTSVLTSIVVEIPPCKRCNPYNAFAYITDMGSNAVIVYDYSKDDAWRVEDPYFEFDPQAGVYKVGGIDFYWRDGVSSAALSAPRKDSSRHLGFSYCDLYLHPTSSTKQFKISTKLLRNKSAAQKDMPGKVEVVGDRGPNSQVTACDIDPKTNVLFYTQVCKNGLGCWNLDKPFTTENTPLIFSDCNLMEFPNDVKVDSEGNVWMLSDRQSRFLYEAMNYNEVNYRVLTAPAAMLVQETTCTMTFFEKLRSYTPL